MQSDNIGEIYSGVLFSVESSMDGKNVLQLNRYNKKLYIGSKYAVTRDIENFKKDIGYIKSNTVIIVFGLATGEHILELISSLSNDNKVIVVEPSNKIIKIFNTLDISQKIVKDKRIHIIPFDVNLTKAFSNCINEHEVINIKIVSFANYSTIFLEEYKKFTKIARIILRNKLISRNTLTYFSKVLFSNYINNMKIIGGAISVNNLKDIFINKPAIIVSAGPSLEKNVHLLKDVQDRFVIICGARTYRSLKEVRVTPDFICAVDPQEATYNIMKDNIDSSVPFLFMESVNYKLVEAYKGPKVMISNQGMEPYIKDITGQDIDSVMQGGSVAHVCMGLGIYLGCSTIIFIGQDLAYTNDKFHADIAKAMQNPGDVAVKYFESNKEKWIEMKEHSIYVEDIFGNKVRTSVLLNSYREEFEDLISDCKDITFINSTEGGANIKGTKIMTLKDSIEMYAADPFTKVLDKYFEYSNQIDQAYVNNMLQVIKQNLTNIVCVCNDGIKYANQMKEYYSYGKKANINKIFNELDKVDAVIGDIQKIGVIAYLLAPYLEEVLSNERFIEKSNETERQSGIRISERCTAMYESIIKASTEALNYF